MNRKTAVFLLLSLSYFSQCSNSTGPNGPNGDIPQDPTNITVPEPSINNLKPTATFAATNGNIERVRINLLGLLDPTQGYQAVEFTANENIFITEDGIVQGFLVKRVGGETVLSADLVFTVDNSGSMSQEADSVAASIAAFANLLDESGLDILFGCVGYGGSGGVNGAINLTSAENLTSYLNDRPSYYGGTVRGTARTVGFAGPDSAQIQTAALGYISGGENGVVGLFYADRNFSFRAGAQRVYVNFTDEPTQPGGSPQWGTDSLCVGLNGRATVHTVWSGGDTTLYQERPLRSENPWRMSECTGGTIKLTPGNAAGLVLSDLPVTGALANSSLLEFVTADPGASHEIVITVKTNSGSDGRTVYKNITY